jgi:hypothetical protein
VNGGVEIRHRQPLGAGSVAEPEGTRRAVEQVGGGKRRARVGAGGVDGLPGAEQVGVGDRRHHPSRLERLDRVTTTRLAHVDNAPRDSQTRQRP